MCNAPSCNPSTDHRSNPRRTLLKSSLGLAAGGGLAAIAPTAAAQA